MNVNDILTRAIIEYYNNDGTPNDFLTPVQVAHWIDQAVLEYWGVFQDNEYSYFNVNESVLNINPNFNIYALPNGDPAQSDQITFSAVPTAGTWVINYSQNGNNYSTTPLAFNASAAAIQAAINANTTGPQVSVTPNWNVANNLGTQTLGFTFLWDLSTLPAAYTGLGPVSYSPFTNSTGVTITATPGAANIFAPNVSFASAMAIRSGSAPNFNYTPIGTIRPNQQFGGNGSIMAAVLKQTQSGSGSGVGWSLAAGLPDGNGYPTLNIRFDPWPTQTFTAVYNGLRNPFKVPILQNGQPLTTYIPDLPLHFHDGVVQRVLKSAYLRAKADTTEIDTLITKFDDTQKAVEERSAQRQGPDLIEDIRNW